MQEVLLQGRNGLQAEQWLDQVWLLALKVICIVRAMIPSFWAFLALDLGGPLLLGFGTLADYGEFQYQWWPSKGICGRQRSTVNLLAVVATKRKKEENYEEEKE